MSLPAHIRSLVSAAAARVRHDREAASAAAEATARAAAQADYKALSDKYEADLVIVARPSWDPVQGFGITWDDCHYPWGPDRGSIGALAVWMDEQFGEGGRFAASVVPVPHTTPLQHEWVWPTYERALAAVLAIAPNSAAYLARRNIAA